ncbi:MAG: hypothetical protein AAFO07_27200, partial [Bacteroidota bacterium]
LITLILLLCFLLLCMHWWEWFADLLSDCIGFLIRLSNGIVTNISSLPFATSQEIWMETMDLILLYLTIVSAFLIFKKRARWIGIIGLASLSLFMMIWQIHKYYQSNHQHIMVVYQSSSGTYIDLIDGVSCLSYLISERSDQKLKENIGNNFRSKSGIKRRKIKRITCSSESNLVIECPSITLIVGMPSLQILNHNSDKPLFIICDGLPKASISGKPITKWIIKKEKPPSHSEHTWYLKKSGAFIHKF